MLTARFTGPRASTCLTDCGGKGTMQNLLTAGMSQTIKLAAELAVSKGSKSQIVCLFLRKVQLFLTHFTSY